MRIAFVFEFIEDGRRVFPVSVGLVAEDGRELYRQFSDAPFERANEWVRANVLTKLTGLHGNRIRKPWGDKGSIAEEIRSFCAPADDDPTALSFVGYYCDYDWVVMCQLFGTMMQLPEGWPMFAWDLRQMLDERGLQHISQPDDMPHQALSDAQWIMATYKAEVQTRPFGGWRTLSTTSGLTLDVNAAAPILVPGLVSANSLSVQGNTTLDGDPVIASGAGVDD